MARLAAVIACFLFSGCDLAYPEVVIVNKTGEDILIKNPSFNGCGWDTVLAYGEATSPGRCLPGADRVRFQKFSAAAYCLEQAEDGEAADVDPGLKSETPTWFNYQTVSAHHVDYGDFQIFEIKLDEMEQDFSTPSPYGH
jgi:hypothetical protein